MDIDDDDNQQQQNPPQTQSRSSRFAPKSKFPPKPKPTTSKAQPKPISETKPISPPPLPTIIKQEPQNDTVMYDSPPPKYEQVDPTPTGPTSMQVDEEKEEEEDVVVAEYDVYYNPLENNVIDSQYYVLQYPLRPAWRPYELDQRCSEVRVKPGTSEFEVDMVLDTYSKYYDPDATMVDKFTKQTLCSKGEAPRVTGYAVGVLMGNKLFLNPVRAVVQLRPSMDYLDNSGSKKKNVSDSAVKQEASSAVDAGPSRKQSKQVDQEVSESWIPLKYHSSASQLSIEYLKKMMREENNSIQFPMSPYDYLNSLCPGTASDKPQSKKPSRRFLLSLPLDERLKTLLVEGPPIKRFSAIKHYAPDDPVEDVLQILQENAFMVQGLWVPKSNIIHPNAEHIVKLARSYLLFLFSENTVIKESVVSHLGNQKDLGKAKVTNLLQEFAVEKHGCKDWKFKGTPDGSFIKLYPDVCDEQRKSWQEIRLMALKKWPAIGSTVKTNMVGSEKAVTPGLSARSDGSAPKAQNGEQKMSMSKETQEALPKILKKVFHTYKVCSFQTLCQGLRDMALSMSTLPKADARAVTAAVAVADGTADPEALQAIICEIAVNVHGRYVLKSSPDHPEFDPLRSVVIDLFLGNGPEAKLKKAEVIEAAKIRLKKEPTNNEFQKVISEICVAKGGAWVLKSGDAIPK